MTSKTSAHAAQTIPMMPPGKQVVTAAPEARGATPAVTTALATGSSSAAEILTSGPTTGARLAQDLDGQKQLEVTGTGAPDTKLAHLLDLLRRPEGTTLAEMCAATGWQVHSVRGAMAGALKRKGHVISSEKRGGARRYRIEAAS